MNSHLGLSYNARKALAVHLGESAGTEVANLLASMAAQIEELQRGKVNVTPIVPGAQAEKDPTATDALENESF